MTTKAELDRALLAGVNAKQTGKKPHDNPFKYRSGRDGELLREAWEKGRSEYVNNRGGAA